MWDQKPTFVAKDMSWEKEDKVLQTMATLAQVLFRVEFCFEKWISVLEICFKSGILFKEWNSVSTTSLVMGQTAPMHQVLCQFARVN